MLQLSAPSPIGIGTQECESLSSFVQRTAEANGTFPGQLVHRILGWLADGHSHEIGGWCHHPRKVYLGRNNNSFGLATIWLKLMAQVVPEAGLIHLTTNQWDFAFPTRGFLHSTLHWCPLCLAADKNPYHRLLWMLGPITICVRHHVMLARLCPRCRRPPPILHDRSLTEICPWCAWDLRAVEATPHQLDERTAIEIGTIIGHFGSTSDTIKWRSHAAIRSLSRHSNIATPVQLARAVGMSKLTTWYWWTGKADMSLPMALHIYSRLGTSFSTAVTTGNHRTIRSSEAVVQTALHLRGRKQAKHIDWDFERNRLQEILERPLTEAPTFISAARELAINRRPLRVYFPDLCRAISQRHRRRLRAQRQHRTRNLQREFGRAIRLLQSAGHEPRQFLIERVLQRPGLFNRRYARVVLSDMLKSLDYSS